MPMAGDPKVKASARVVVTLEIDVGDHWGGDCPTSQVQRQAKDSALHLLRRAFTPCANHDGCSFHPVRPRLIGEPAVTVILVEEARS